MQPSARSVLDKRIFHYVHTDAPFSQQAEYVLSPLYDTSPDDNTRDEGEEHDSLNATEYPSRTPCATFPPDSTYPGTIETFGARQAELFQNFFRHDDPEESLRNNTGPRIRSQTGTMQSGQAARTPQPYDAMAPARQTNEPMPIGGSDFPDSLADINTQCCVPWLCHSYALEPL